MELISNALGAVFVTIVCAALGAKLAPGRGQNPALWFFICLLAPLVGLLALLILYPELSESKASELALEQEQDQTTHRNCPKCGELVLRVASVCRYCQSVITPKFSDDVTVNAHVVKIDNLLKSRGTPEQIAQQLNRDGVECALNDGVWTADITQSIIEEFKLQSYT